MTTGWPQAGQSWSGAAALPCLSSGAEGKGKQFGDAKHYVVVSAWFRLVRKWWKATPHPFFLVSLERGNQLEQEKIKKWIPWVAAESIPSRRRNPNVASGLNHSRSYRVSGMTLVSKSSDEVCLFMHNKWIFVVLATAWRCVIHQGNSLFWCCQGDKLATCPCCCWSSPAQQFFSWLLCACAWDVLRAISWLYTEHCYLQLWQSSHQHAYWSSALLPSGLTWTDSSRATWKFSLCWFCMR